MDFAQKGLLRFPIRKRQSAGIDVPGLNQGALGRLLERLSTGVLVFNEMRCLYWNGEAEAVLAKLSFAPTPATLLSDVIAGALSVQEDVDSGCVYLKRVMGPAMNPVDIEFSIVEAQGQTPSILLIHDVSELLANREVVKQLDSLLVVGELAAGIAHEIRNPLATIRGFTQMIRNSQDLTSVGVYADIMIEELDRMNGLVEELLQLARPRTQRFEETNLIGLLDTVVFLLNPQAILKNCSVVFERQDRFVTIPIMCQPNRLKQVFINVIKNAVEASPHGSTVRVCIVALEKTVTVSVVDEGTGMPPEYLADTDKKFFTTKENGTGLGLMISRNIVREHEGNLLFFNHSQRGTMVQVILPVSNEVHHDDCRVIE